MIENSNKKYRRLWKFESVGPIVFIIVLMVILMITVALMKKIIDWPSSESEDIVLIGIFIISLLPIIMIIIDTVSDRGGKIEYGNMKIDFSLAGKKMTTAITVPINIGVSGKPISDSSTMEILDALNKAVSNNVIIIDLEKGDAWWETRLLVLLAGANKIGKPEVIIFIGTEAGVDQKFQGWGYAEDLLQCLLKVNSQYQHSYNSAVAAAKQWEMVEPPLNGIPVAIPKWMDQGLATLHPWMAFDNNSGLPNLHLSAQLLASDLGTKIESISSVKTISLIRFEEIFKPVIHKDCIDELWTKERQTQELINSNDSFVAVTRNGRYTTLLSRIACINEILKALIDNS